MISRAQCVCVTFHTKNGYEELISESRRSSWNVHWAHHMELAWWFEHIYIHTCIHHFTVPQLAGLPHTSFRIDDKLICFYAFFYARFSLPATHTNLTTIKSTPMFILRNLDWVLCVYVRFFSFLIWNQCSELCENPQVEKKFYRQGKQLIQLCCIDIANNNLT